MFKGKTILITGGTGTWGQELTKQALENNVQCILIYSRGEKEQVFMQRQFNNDSHIKFIIGDVRDENALRRVFKQYQPNIVYHLAALKHVPICEYQVEEAIKTNINGTLNVVNCSGDYGVEKMILVSTDKTVQPINVYGFTKGLAERIVIEANCRFKQTSFLCIRAGNVLGSNGSFIPLIIEQIKQNKPIILTDDAMTRYFITVDKIIDSLLFVTQEGQAGEIYIPTMPAYSIRTIIECLMECYGTSFDIRVMYPREGEKLHETIISDHEISRTHYVNNCFHVIYPQIKIGKTNFHIWDHFEYESSVPLNSIFRSDQNIQDHDTTMKLLKDGGFI